MRIPISILTLFLFTNLLAQPIENTLLGTWSDETLVESDWIGNVYNEVWGMVVDDREYAIIGSTKGTHFIDVTDPNSPEEVAVIDGAVSGSEIIHRDFHDHRGYLYVVADEGDESTLQIMDYSGLPDNVKVVYDSKEYIRRSHNIFIDAEQDILYSCISGGDDIQGGFVPLRLFDISDPMAPVPMISYSEIGGFPFSQIHDAYIRDGIAYLNCGPGGFALVDFNDADNPILLASLTTADYPQAGYNHSGWLSDDGTTYYMADETHDTDIKVIDVTALPELTVIDTIDAGSDDPSSIPHNLIIRGNYLYASYYYDGLQIWNIEDKENITRAFYYDTYPGTYESFYHGAWGVYPLLPSGNILVSDMQTGLYVFEKIDETISSLPGEKETLDIEVFPNPSNGNITIRLGKDGYNSHIQLVDALGRNVYKTTAFGSNIDLNLPQTLSSGSYQLQVERPSGIQGNTRIVLVR